MKLDGKTIVVTGSGTGIGKAIAKICVNEGAQVVINDKDGKLAQETVEELGQEKTIAHIRDLTDEDCPKELIALAKERFGRIDGLVNNAAFVTWSDIASTEPDYFKKVLDVNLVAPLALIQAALPELKRNKGSVVNIGSVNAHCGEPTLLAYSASKGGLTTLSLIHI